MVFHVLNLGVGRIGLFRKQADYEAFDRVIEQTLVSAPAAYLCLLPDAEPLAFRGLAPCWWSERW